MSGVTPNYGWILPAAGEAYDVVITNDNNTQIDADLKAETTKIQHVEWLRVGQNDAPANTPWGPGAFNPLLDPGIVTENGGFATAGAGNDQIKVTEEGLYAFTWTLTNVAGTTESFWLRLGDTGNTFQYGATPVVSLLNNEVMMLGIPNIHLEANDTVQVRFSCGGANKAVNHRFKLSKF